MCVSYYGQVYSKATEVRHACVMWTTFAKYGLTNASGQAEIIPKSEFCYNFWRRNHKMKFYIPKFSENIILSKFLFFENFARAKNISFDLFIFVVQWELWIIVILNSLGLAWSCHRDMTVENLQQFHVHVQNRGVGRVLGLGRANWPPVYFPLAAVTFWGLTIDLYSGPGLLGGLSHPTPLSLRPSKNGRKYIGLN